MATCKDCIHYDVCGFNEYKDFNEICSFFKDKSRIVELPCKVGDKVHKIIKSNIFDNSCTRYDNRKICIGCSYRF